MIITGTAKKTKLDYVLTAVSPNFPRQRQIDAIFKSLPAIGTVIVGGHTSPVPNRDGVEFFSTENPVAKIREIIKAWFAKNPFDSTIAICKPTIVISTNVKSCFEFMEKSGTGKAWVFYANGPAAGSPPEIFITTKIVLEHVLKAIPTDLTFEGDEWSNWLEEWFARNMPIHRFVDATKYGIVSERVQAPPEPPSIISVNSLLADTLTQIAPSRVWARNIISPPEPPKAPEMPASPINFDEDAKSPEVDVKVAKKRGRPRKALKTTK